MLHIWLRWGDRMSTFLYVIDHMDRIVSMSSNWLSFAARNDAGESCHPDRIINQQIWSFIQGYETRHVYEICINNVRNHQKTIVLPFRCDAPDLRRYLELEISPLPRGHVQLTSRIIREEPRETVKLLQTGKPKLFDFITMCSMCKKIQVAENVWFETEEAIARLGLFELEVLPQISHGLCQDCFKMSIDEADQITI